MTAEADRALRSTVLLLSVQIRDAKEADPCADHGLLVDIENALFAFTHAEASPQ